MVADVWTEMLLAMKVAQINPAIVYATARTGIMLSSDNRHLFSSRNLREWDRAIREYESIVVPNEILTTKKTTPSYLARANAELPTAPVVFLSYCWKDGDTAEIIFNQFNQFNLKLRKDNIDISYKNSIQEYMGRVRKSDYVLMLISNNYFRSCNCVLEALDIAESSRFQQQILPIILDSYTIFRPQERIRLIKYWDSKIDKLNSEIRELKPSSKSIAGLEKELEKYHKVRGGLDDVLSALSDMKIPTLKELVKTGYEEILRVIASTESEKISQGIRILNICDPYFKMSELTKFKTAFADDKYPMFLEGVITYEAGNLDIAEACFEKVISEWPDYEPAYVELAILKAEKDQLGKAQSILEQVLRINPANALVMYNLGCLCFKVGKEKDAIHWFKAAMSVNPYDSEALQNMGAILYNSRQYRDACKCFVKAIKLNPLDAKAHLNLGKLLSDPFMRYDDAKILLKKSHSIDKNPSPLLELARIHMQLDEISQARICINKAMKLEPDNAEAKIQMAFIEDSKEKRQCLYFSLRRILTISDSNFKNLIEGIEEYHSQSE